MKAEVKKIEGIQGTVIAPPSKSYTHRAFIIASLAEGTSVIKNPLLAGDTRSTIKAIKAFGISIDEGNDITIHGRGGRLETPSKPIDCENSGTTIRLMSGVTSLDGKVTLTGDESVQKRPMQPLLDALKQSGIKAYSDKVDGTPPVVIYGGNLKGGLVKIRGDISSQFISSLLIISPYAKDDMTLEITTPLKSRPYVDITLDIMKKFGINVKNEDYRRFISTSRKRYSATEYTVEGDYSSASYFLALAAMTKSELKVQNLQGDSKQGDKIIIDILKKMGAQVTCSNSSVIVKGNKLKGVDVDLGDTPDLLPTIVALACKAKGETVIRNIEHARYKETDRLAACASEFRKFGPNIEERRDSLTIRSNGLINGAEVKTYGDHRMAMALTIAGLSADGTTTVDDVSCAKISFPMFFDILKDICPEEISVF